MIKIGNTELSAIYYGSREISAVYKGSTLIWQKQVPVPSSELVYAMLSGTGAYAKYNGFWTLTSVVDEFIGVFGFYKADQALTGNLNDNSFITLNNPNWPKYDGVETTYSALGFKNDWLTARNGSPIFYSKDFATYPSTYLDFTLPMTFSASGFTQGASTVTPSTTYWYDGNGFNETSGGHPGTLISCYLSAVPFDESYKTFMMLDSYNVGNHQGYFGPFKWVSGATWIAEDYISYNDTPIFFEAGYWNTSSHTWDRTPSSQWGVIIKRSPVEGFANLKNPTAPWPWLEPNTTNWQLWTFESTPAYGKIKFIPMAESFKGYTITGAGDSSINGNYILSGTHNGYNKYQKEGGTSILAFYDNKWRLYSDEMMLDMAPEGCYYAPNSPITTWTVGPYGSSPAPNGSLYVSFGDEGGGGGGGVGNVTFTCGGGTGSITLNGVTKSTGGGGQQVTFEDLPEGEYSVTYGFQGTGPASVTVVAGETTSVTCNFPCFVAGTKITLADGSEKNVENITYQDELLTWDFDKGEYASSKPIWILQEGEAPIYMLSIYEDGKELKTVGPTGMHHEIYNADENTFDYTDNMVGKKTFTIDGIKQCISTKLVKEPVKYYNIITAKHFNLFANGILTSCRLNNLYPIKNMQYVKDGERNFKHPALEKIDKNFLDGLRVSELDESYDGYILALTRNKLQ